MMAEWSKRLAPRVTAKLNLITDALVVVGAVFLARVADRGAPVATQTAIFAAGAVLAWLAGSFILRFYDPWANRLALDDAALLSLLVLGEAILLGSVRFLWPELAFPRVGHFALVLWPAVVVPRLFLFRRLARLEPPIDEVLIVGVGTMARCTAEDLQKLRWPKRRVLGLLRFADEPRTVGNADFPLLGDVSQLQRILEEHPVDEVYLAGKPQQHATELQAAIATCERMGVPFALPACPFRLGRARAAHREVSADGFLHFVNVKPSPQQMAVKRLFDLCASAVALVLLSPLLLGVAIAIKLTSRGPIFFRQLRVGLYGRPFHMFKFRSMVVDAEALQERLAALNEQSGPVFKITNDPRITRIGRFIRKYSIDELPQLLNVLRGEMSIVGPRPPVPKEVAQYAPWQRRRLSVRPGLTCIWQVSGRNQISFKEWMYLDMRYIDHWSLGEDLSLVLKTVPVVFTGRGAS